MNQTEQQPVQTDKFHSTGRLHLVYLDGIRALAALYVLLTHIAIHERHAQKAAGGVASWLLASWNYGHFAVDLFIVLSGFSLMLPVLRSDGILPGGARRFFVKRCWRILPPYYLAIVAAYLNNWFILDRYDATRQVGSSSISHAGLFAHLLLVQDLFHHPIIDEINGSFWTISVEFRIYFLFPILIWAWGRVGAIKTTFMALVASYALLVVLHRTPINTFDQGCSPQYIALFVYGMMAAEIAYGSHAKFQAWNRPQLLLPLGGCCAIISIYLASAPIWRGHPIPLTLVDALFGIAACCMLICASHPGTLQKLCSVWPLSHIGVFAYSLYLMHVPLLNLFWYFVASRTHLMGLPHILFVCIFGIPLIVAGAFLYFLMCERPFLRMRQAAMKRR